MKTVRVVLSDNNKAFINSLCEILKRENWIEIVGYATDGLNCINLVKSLKPDLLISDIITPIYDGIEILERINNDTEISKNRPKVIILSAINKDNITQRVINLGADYFMTKPFDAEILIKRIKELFENGQISPTKKSYISVNTISNNNIENKETNKFLHESGNLEISITNILHSLGVPPHVSGYCYLREGINLSVEDSSLLKSVTRRLYPAIAKKYDTTPSRVERAMRHAIELSWARNANSDIAKKIFGNTLNLKKTRPTNSEFVSLLSDRLRLEKSDKF